MNSHQHVWHELSEACRKRRVPHALLIVSELDESLVKLTQNFAQLIFCKSEHAPCNICLDCQLITKGDHPDRVFIKSEKPGSSIKIDQIRDLQNNCFIPPQRANHRLIFIEAVDLMNNAAANALLKILEEPPSHIIFVLQAKQINTVLPTVRSRCHLFYDFSNLDLLNQTFNDLAELYSPNSELQSILYHASNITDDLISLVDNKKAPLDVAAEWSKYHFESLLWLLYLVYAQIQTMLISESISVNKDLNILLNKFSAIKIFHQLDKIISFNKKLSQNIHINSLLALEDLLFDL